MRDRRKRNGNKDLTFSSLATAIKEICLEGRVFFRVKNRGFVNMAFAEIGVEIAYKGTGINEKGFVKCSSNLDYPVEIGKEVLSVDPR